MEYDYKAIGERVEKERRELKLSKAKLAEKIGYSDERPITALEKNGKLLPLEQMLEMCKIFNCELSYLLCEQDYKTRVATDICEETGLSEEAVNYLIDEVDKAQYFYNKYGISLGRQFRKYLHDTRFIDFFIYKSRILVREIEKMVGDVQHINRLKKTNEYNSLHKIFEYSKECFPENFNYFGKNYASDTFYRVLLYLIINYDIERITDEQIEEAYEFTADNEAFDYPYFNEKEPDNWDTYQGVYDVLERTDIRNMKMQHNIISDLFKDVVEEYIGIESKL